MMIRVASAKDVAVGGMHVFDVEGTKVNVVNVNGHLFAFDDTCTHTGCSLSNGRLHGTTVTCPCHGSQFDVTSGAVLRGPATRPVRSRLVQVEHEELLTEA
jgi:nitrite reductase/ring-hydroxylating ferredoxin subunit